MLKTFCKYLQFLINIVTRYQLTGWFGNLIIISKIDINAISFIVFLSVFNLILPFQSGSLQAQIRIMQSPLFDFLNLKSYSAKSNICGQTLALLTNIRLSWEDTTRTNTIVMFVERQVCSSALFTYLVGWYASAVRLPSSDVILAQLACPLSDIMFCSYSGINKLSLYKDCTIAYESIALMKSPKIASGCLL